MLDATDSYQDIRDAIRALCGEYPPEYFRRIDQERPISTNLILADMAEHVLGLPRSF